MPGAPGMGIIVPSIVLVPPAAAIACRTAPDDPQSRAAVALERSGAASRIGRSDRLPARHDSRPHGRRGLYERRIPDPQPCVGRGRSSVDGRQDGPRHRCDLGARPGGRRGVCPSRRARAAARAQRGARGASARCRGRGDGQPRRAGVSVRRERPARRAGVRRALHRRRAAPRRAGQQRRRAPARAGGLRRRQRARACDERARTVPAHEPADPSAHGERSGAGHHRLLGRDVHAAAPCRGPAVDGREVRRTDGVRADQAHAGDPHRAVGEAARRHAVSSCTRCTPAGWTRRASRPRCRAFTV